MTTEKGFSLTCAPRTKLCLEGGGYIYAEEVEQNMMLNTYFGMDTIKTDPESIPRMTRKTGQLVSINLWTQAEWEKMPGNANTSMDLDFYFSRLLGGK